MKQQAVVQLAGRDVTVRESTKPLRKRYGYYGGNEIVLSCELEGQKKLEIFLHEALHALFYFLDESVVETSAAELAEALETLDLT